MQIHVVQSGDTLWRISQQYGVNMNQIVRANDLDDPNRIVIGQALVIPAPYPQYSVQPSDTLWAIAQRFGTTIQEILIVNRLVNPSVLYVGQVLTIPVLYHTIQPGETLWVIARRYNTTVEAIAQANQIENPAVIYSGQRLRIPDAPKPVIDVNAYTTTMLQPGAELVAPLTPFFTYVTPFSHGFSEDGSLTPLNDQAIIAVAWERNVAPLLVLTNFVGTEFSSDRAAILLRNPELQETLITNILNMIREKGYRGLNIDFEYVYPEDRENYNNFLRRVVARLRPEGYSVSTALAPKENAEQQGLLYEAHDYAAHGEIVDFVVLMTYEWGWAGGRPWAIAPINKVRDILDYAVTAIPRDKILMGVPLYGRDWKIPWVEGTYARTVSPKEAVNLALQYGVAIEYDETYQSPFFRYTDETGQQHEVWFEDARSVNVKYQTVKDYGIRGISYWVLGPSFPQNWPVLADHFRARKV
ncbi:LysM peptidoglycan-binding domain-containing protein [Alkalihalobacillus sp. AL-G]|uniref:LysM peptidoglycan-binding domain-containing protein n=1 Tax=Alkalihalobacillus sp. AL-G TaxID=2926399 RepID=UPI00272C4A05|nr:LysM peptidoglycan-binding domain-containing protein [Alkalihalobacillus sp. AL-G]WLD92632.1 LysM peptidoglycan-binding domain-containing protein [Alkalihalobacillus sp. AL-G]